MIGLLLTALLSNFPGVQIIRVIDGDTFVVNLPEQADVFGREISVRLAGIDTAEIRDKRACARQDAEAAKKLLSRLLSDTKVDLIDCTREKYFRILCEATVSPGVNVSETMIGLKKAVPYYGKAKQEWVCGLSTDRKK
ncbi:MAG TPA: thermonuclease family protein [Oligoflexus sp.]|uniref:thermonuclease family protein n=1 Tax=Oligoflexus sp. TaxID=1971216 RepID=UPI002D41ABDD|nr:thermonuclease family protein [Oligoflexus sp.]HYX39986.1 thermonuclease family protein [Oligoflexus sp.]